MEVDSEFCEGWLWTARNSGQTSLYLMYRKCSASSSSPEWYEKRLRSETILKYHSTLSPFVPPMLWLAAYGRRNFLWDTGEIHRIRCILHYYLIYLFIYLWNHSHFKPQLLNFCFRWQHYSLPNTKRSLSLLPASLSYFHFLVCFACDGRLACWVVVLRLPITGFPAQRYLYKFLPTYHQRFSAWKLTMKFKTNSSELPTTEDSNVRLHHLTNSS